MSAHGGEIYLSTPWVYGAKSEDWQKCWQGQKWPTLLSMPTFLSLNRRVKLHYFLTTQLHMLYESSIYRSGTCRMTLSWICFYRLLLVYKLYASVALEATVCNRHVDDMTVSVPNAMVIRPGKLTRLSLSYCQLKLNWAAFSQNHITHLKLHYISSQTQPTMKQLFDVLREMTRLESLNLRDAFTTVPIQNSSDNLYIPRLQSLNLTPYALRDILGTSANFSIAYLTLQLRQFILA